MKRYPILLTLILTTMLFSGCASSWPVFNPNEKLRENGWEKEYCKMISGREVKIFTGHDENQLPKLEIFCFNDFLGNSWDRVGASFDNGRIVGFYFYCKNKGRLISTKHDAEKNWQKSFVRTLKNSQYLTKLPPEIQVKVKRLIAYADKKYYVRYSNY